MQQAPTVPTSCHYTRGTERLVRSGSSADGTARAHRPATALSEPALSLEPPSALGHSGDAAADALARQDCAAAMEQLSEAPQWMGAGAKTAAGYGRMLSEATLEQAKAARAQAALAQSGIKLGQETWEGATFTWDPGRRALNVTSSTGRTAKSDGAEAEALVSAGVSKEDAARMQKKGKKLKGTAFVEAVGNRVKVVRIEVPVTA